MAGCLSSEGYEGSRQSVAGRMHKVKGLESTTVLSLSFGTCCLATLAVSQLSPISPGHKTPITAVAAPLHPFPPTSTSVDELQQRLIGLSSN